MMVTIKTLPHALVVKLNATAARLEATAADLETAHAERDALKRALRATSTERASLASQVEHLVGQVHPFRERIGHVEELLARAGSESAERLTSQWYQQEVAFEDLLAEKNSEIESLRASVDARRVWWRPDPLIQQCGTCRGPLTARAGTRCHHCGESVCRRCDMYLLPLPPGTEYDNVPGHNGPLAACKACATMASEEPRPHRARRGNTVPVGVAVCVVVLSGAAMILSSIRVLRSQRFR